MQKPAQKFCEFASRIDDILLIEKATNDVTIIETVGINPIVAPTHKLEEFITIFQVFGFCHSSRRLEPLVFV
jgi:hypothetical protein